MRSKFFESPPFIVWRILNASKDTPPSSSYRLVTHSVWLHLLLQALTQSAGAVAVIYFSEIFYHPRMWWMLGAILIFLCFAVATNIFILWLLNSRPMQPIEALLLLAPKGARSRFEQSFPVTYMPQSSGLFPRAYLRFLLTFQTTWYLFEHLYIWCGNKIYAAREPIRNLKWWRRRQPGRKKSSQIAFRVWRFTRNSKVGFIIGCLRATVLSDGSRRGRWKNNLARLRALRLRREDSNLRAFSAYAVVNCFVPFRYRSVAGAQIKFLLSYFSPPLFGFIICVFIFLVFTVSNLGMKKSALIPCITIWFFQSLLYSLTTLRQDFAAQFANYFDTRPFPNRMTISAKEQMALAPDLVQLAQEKWLSLVVTTAIFGLASLYAGILQNLGD